MVELHTGATDALSPFLPLAVLSTATHAFYEALDWERWRGPTFVAGAKGRARTPGR